MPFAKSGKKAGFPFLDAHLSQKPPSRQHGFASVTVEPWLYETGDRD